MNFKTFSMTAVAGSVLLASQAMAGFTASTGTGTYSYSGVSLAAPVVGNTITVANQGFASYTPDTAADPQITAGDLSQFRFNLSLTITGIDPGGVLSTSGTYSIKYAANNALVSGGNASLFLTPVIGGIDSAAGTLTQNAGPSAGFADLAYANFSTVGNTFGLTFRQDAVVAPEPTTLAALAGAGLLAARRRRA
jgi:hypothetical protein